MGSSATDQMWSLGLLPSLSPGLTFSEGLLKSLCPHESSTHFQDRDSPTGAGFKSGPSHLLEIPATMGVYFRETQIYSYSCLCPGGQSCIFT